MTFQDFIAASQHIEVEYAVTPDVYHSFQRASADYNPLHTDRAFAQSMGYGQCVMYGNILNCFVSHFVGMALPSRSVMIMAQDIKYRKPVFMNDTLALTAEIDEVSELVKYIKYKLKFYRANDGRRELVASGHVDVKVGL